MTVLSERIRAHVRVGAGVAIIANFYVCKNVIGLCGAACVCVGGWGEEGLCAIRDSGHISSWLAICHRQRGPAKCWVGCVCVGEGRGGLLNGAMQKV